MPSLNLLINIRPSISGPISGHALHVPFCHLKITLHATWWGESKWCNGRIFKWQKKEKPNPLLKTMIKGKQSSLSPGQQSNYEWESCSVVIIAGWSGSILHDYHKCVRWEEGSGRIYQAANPHFPSLCSQRFLQNPAMYSRDAAFNSFARFTPH